jgi:uncharacterized membrane protein
MVGIAGVVVWLGYAVFAFGWSQVRGCNAGFLAMLSPFGAQPVCNPDGPAAKDQSTPTKITAKSSSANMKKYGTPCPPGKAWDALTAQCVPL